MSIPPSYHHDQNLVNSPHSQQSQQQHNQAINHANPLNLEIYAPPPASLYPSYISEFDLGGRREYHQPQQMDSAWNLDSLTQQQDVYRSVAIDTYSNPASSGPWDLTSLQMENEAVGQSFSDFDLPRTQLSMNPKDGFGSSMNPKDGFGSSLDYSVKPSSEVECENAQPQEQVKEPPTPPGGYLDPNTHFFINTPPEQALNELTDLLKSKNVDCEVWASCYKMKCLAYRECASVEFYVRIFSTTTEQRRANKFLYAVEFQRRFGDGMAFHNLYNDLKNDYLQRTAGSKPCSVKQIASLTCPALDLPDMQCCRQQQKEVIRSLVKMCESECVDVKSQAIMALAEMAANANCQLKEVMLANGVVETFTRSLCCKYSDVHRCAVTGLANMISCRKNYAACNGLLSDNDAREALNELIRTGCPQVVRECARSFALLVDTMKSTVRDDECVQSCVQALLASRDSQARELALHVQNTLAMP